MSKKLKTNLEEVMSGIGSSLGSPSTLPGSAKASKFKPKVAGSSTSGLPSFRTAGFGLKAQDTQEIIIVSDSPSTSSSSLKRSSSDPHVAAEPSPPPPKRSRREDAFSNKENLVRATSNAKGKGKLVAMELDDEPQLRRTPLSENLPRTSPALYHSSGPRVEAQPSSAPEGSPQDIKNWVSHCHILRAAMCDELLEFHEGDRTKDATLLKLIREVIDNRMSVLQGVAAPPVARPHTEPPKERHFQDLPQASTHADPVYDLTGDNDNEEDLWDNFDEPDITMVETQQADQWGPLKVPTQSSVTLPSIPSSPPEVQVINSPYTKQLTQVLRNVFKLENFRKNQLEAVVASMEDKDVFILMPTGGGKSLCYQLPAVCVSQSKGQITFVVTPLIALMDDQVKQLQNRFGVNAMAWGAESNVTEALLASGQVPIVYVTPEKLSASGYTRSIIQRLHQKGMIARFVIDEAHCISSWGQDFRDAYANLGELRKLYPEVPIMALTATANPTTINDIIHQLNLQDPVRLVQSFNRSNLSYTIREKKGTPNKQIIEDLKTKYLNQCGVIYCRAKKGCEDLSADLQRSGIRAAYYHAGMPPDERQRAAADWQSGKVLVVVATIAFGMGIDKADVRFVFHRDMPKTVSGYYQETGRAGRDGLPADCIMYYNYTDLSSVRRMIRETENATEESIARQIDALKEMYFYCSNNSTCRRVQVLGHFNEKFDEKDCKKSCDVCLDPRQLVETDASDATRILFRFLRAAASKRISIAQGQLASAVRGMGGQSIKSRFGDLDGFGEAKGHDGDLIDLLIKDLLGQDVLDTQDKQSGGFHTAYIELGTAAASFERGLGRKPYRISWRPKSGKPKAPTRVPSSAAAPNSKRKGKATEIQDDPIEDDRDLYNMTDDEGASLIPARAPPRRTRNDNATPGPSSISAPIPAPAPPMSRSASRNHVRPVSSVPASVVIPVTSQDVRVALSPEEFHNKLRQVRLKCKQKSRIDDENDVLDDLALEMLSLLCPEDYVHFKKVVADAVRDLYEGSETPEQDAMQYAEKKWTLYGQEFLNACIEQKTSSLPSATKAFPPAATFEYHPPSVAARANSSRAPTLVTTPIPMYIAPPSISVPPKASTGGKKFKPK